MSKPTKAKPSKPPNAKRITATALNKANRIFWDYETLREKAEHHLSDEERVVMRGYAAIEERMKRIAARKGTMNSVAKRRNSIAERNQRWLDAHASGKTRKQIHLDQPEGQEVSLSTINRTLKGLRRK